jgi:hypothetical protein
LGLFALASYSIRLRRYRIDIKIEQEGILQRIEMQFPLLYGEASTTRNNKEGKSKLFLLLCPLSLCLRAMFMFAARVENTRSVLNCMGIAGLI